MPRNSQSPPSAVETTSSLAIERFERFVTDWEFREYAYHL
jgi:hypothetical protein